MYIYLNRGKAYLAFIKRIITSIVLVGFLVSNSYAQGTFISYDTKAEDILFEKEILDKTSLRLGSSNVDISLPLYLGKIDRVNSGDNRLVFLGLEVRQC